MADVTDGRGHNQAMSSDLVAFIEARLTEDETIARAAAGAHLVGRNWHVEPWYDGTGERCDIRAGVTGDLTVHGGMELPVAHHAVRHDPARVLREVEAKRRHIARYNEVEQLLVDAPDHPSAIRNELLSVRRAYRLTLQDDAGIWSDHADHRAEWAVTHRGD